MRTLLCAIPALLALAGTALAEPQQLDEAQLGDIAAGQTSINSTSNVMDLSTSSFSLSSFENIRQTLGGSSANTVHATGLDSSNVTASGMSGTTVTGGPR
jgi:hypothetical protein